TNALVCLSVMPALSLPPLALALIAMRSAAPSSPAAAGAAVGRLAAAVAASLYALHCFDDSPLFVAVWYPLATLPVILLGSFAGQRLLRW
ncbi:MAG: NrsF family protein, partial [Hyphomicrobiaceae bacterium]